MTRFAARRSRLMKLVKETGAEGLLVSNFTNVTYLTGFTGDSSHLVLTGRDEILVSDFRYITQLEEECPGLRTHIRPSSILLRDAVIEVLGTAKIGRLAIEGDSFTVADFAHLTDKLSKLTILATTGLVEQLRESKDEEEIAEIRRAIEVAERAFGVFRETLSTDRTEKELADTLDHLMRRDGAVSSSFPTIVAAGPQAALPHARPRDDALLHAEDLLLVDWGANCGYKSDLTRVLVTGRISPKLEMLYGVVLKAQEQAIAAIRPGKTGREIDAIARGIIADSGYDKYFGHGLGHGIGLEVHELPRLSPLNEKPLEAGMVVTVEPGIYLPGWGGIRIEDDVLVTEQGHEVLTSCPKQLTDAIVH